MSVSDIKRSQKESLLFREVASLFLQLTLDNPILSGLSITRTQLSSDKSVCKILFYHPEGKAKFDELLEVLKLYRPSVRKALADRVRFRYVPEILFKFDAEYSKQVRIDELFEKLKNKGEL